METKTVKNISNNDLDIVDIGRCKVGQTIEVPLDFNNVNFEEVKKEKVETTDEQTVKKENKKITK